MKRRVVVVGMGVLASNGIGVQAFRDAIFAGKSGIGLITRFDPSSLDIKIAAEIKDFDVNGFIALCRKKFPHAQVSGGGHRVAGSVTFISAAFKEMCDALEEYVEGLGK